jgi:ribosome biogenesis GTPase A
VSNLRDSETASSVSVLDALARLDAAVDPDQRPAVAELVRRMDDDRFRILVVGEAKRGKSTLINALLARDLLPVGVVPVTTISTTVTHGSPERLIIAFHDGRVARTSPDELGHFVDERANPRNRLGVATVTVQVDAPIVRDGVELVDTPGTGSVLGHGAETERALETMDAAIMVLTADPPLSASERQLLARVAAAAVQTSLW